MGSNGGARLCNRIVAIDDLRESEVSCGRKNC